MKKVEDLTSLIQDLIDNGELEVLTDEELSNSGLLNIDIGTSEKVIDHIKNMDKTRIKIGIKAKKIVMG